MNPREYLSVALQRLDLLLHREILRLRASYQLSLDEFRGLYISDAQVNQLVNGAVNYEGPSSAIDELTDRAESLRADPNSQSDSSPWYRLVAEFSLSALEQDAFLADFPEAAGRLSACDATPAMRRAIAAEIAGAMSRVDSSTS